MNRELIKYGPSGSMRIGELPQGCVKCINGEKIVLYMTGHCSVGCAYCPIPEDKQKINDVYVNERQIDLETNAFDMLQDESNNCLAEGAGITGGDPMEVPERTMEYIKEMREMFGRDYHLHLYTSGIFFKENLGLIDQLFEAGLDELRFHPKNITAKPIWDIAAYAKDKYPDKEIGFEIPAIPGKEEAIKELIRFADAHSLDFVNLNEYEFTSSNFNKLSQRGFVSVLSNSAIVGSQATAEKVLRDLKDETSITIHYCSSGSKDSIQLVQRFKKRASKIKRPFDDISEEGELEYARFLLDSKDDIDLLEKLFIEVYEVEKSMYQIFQDELIIETGWFIVEEILKDLRENYMPDVHAEIIARHPIENGPITWVDPL
ncbi:MAG: hypothetical protein IH840_13890 [Candidatus Heimdallarchaeota archaeon]|nr:hypothetical protein [Candidatus Heimdallarchaeota archaeon]